MNRISIKLRITLWYTLFMTLIVVLLISTLVIINKALFEASIKNDLMNKMRSVQLENIKNYEQGVFLSVYDTPKDVPDFMKYGTVPPEFDNTVQFKADTIQTIENNDSNSKWFVYDRRIATNTNGNVWVRGVISITETTEYIKNTIKLSLIILPIIIIIAAAGGYLIANRAFKPVKIICRSADEIAEGKDLSKRINLSNGKNGKDEIYELAATFDRMIKRLQTAFESEKQFTSDVSHELRTPTAVIISQSEYALDILPESDSGEVRKALEVILNRSNKMSTLISQLLSLAKTDKAHRKLNLEQVNLSELTDVVIEQQIEFAEEKSIEISAEIEQDICITADETLLMRMLINLISNAVTYGKEHGHIMVRLHRNGDNAVIEVQDDGIGINETDIGRIFDRFYQADSSRTSNDNIGLGLSIVKWTAEAHGGNVEVKSKVGEGSVFTVELPEKRT